MYIGVRQLSAFIPQSTNSRFVIHYAACGTEKPFQYCYFFNYLEDMPPFDVFEGDSLVEAHKHEEVVEVDVLQHKRTHDKHYVGLPN